MKAPILCLLLILGTAAARAAVPIPAPPAEGNYGFSGDFRADVKLHYETVYGFTDAGQAELAKRNRAGDECWNTGREIYLCKSFATTDGAAAVIAGRVSRALAGKVLHLGMLTGQPSLISQGADVAEYEVAQPASFDRKSYDSYRLVYTQGNWSVRLGEATDAQFNLEGGSLRMPIEVPVTESRTEYSVYGVEAEFKP